MEPELSFFQDDQFGGCAKRGFFEPNNIIAESVGKFDAPKDISGVGKLSVEYGTPIASKERRKKRTVSGAAGFDGIQTPHINRVEYVRAETLTSQCALAKISENCTAKDNDSESLAIHASTSLEWNFENQSVNLAICSGWNCRQAVAFIISAARSFSSAASFSRIAARSFALAAALFAVAAAPVAAASSRFNAVSLMFPVMTTNAVAITPTTRVPTRTQLDQNDRNSAQGSDIPVPIPFLILLPGVILAALSGIWVMIQLVRLRQMDLHE